jgi:hypothetical protein
MDVKNTSWGNFGDQMLEKVRQYNILNVNETSYMHYTVNQQLLLTT